MAAIPDPDDVHVALAAAYLAKHLGEAIVLTTENLKDLPTDVLKARQVAVMHPGDLLQLLYERDAQTVSASLLKTAADFKKPAITPEQMLRSIASRNQFSNQPLASELAKAWSVAPPSALTKKRRTASSGSKK